MLVIAAKKSFSGLFSIFFVNLSVVTAQDKATGPESNFLAWASGQWLISQSVLTVIGSNAGKKVSAIELMSTQSEKK